MGQEYVIIISSSEGLNPQTSQYEVKGFVGFDENKKLTKVDSLEKAARFHGLKLERHLRNQIHSISPGNKFIIAQIKQGNIRQKVILA
ncbi:hypothetical protein COU00_03950 [Candidatus Falkowbacteria bacterium CG10_big_fil_rev_8_21_14_0_10_43_11]|uniref:Uncharacterized protein n=1 Tax=Candidatus Falkowbacteria bacterium CG10_big_fil_rev_8_21_14_0_10_43_11 TaxID=1974568 RepID=A0A2M6WL50_9BACT|nr:MAG: hypothetical protein COU00_03950 [Candidatus Falkowbacteria bacterium CG10_big_fil_rev_8_21_14_0_10_43_11]